MGLPVGSKPGHARPAWLPLRAAILVTKKVGLLAHAKWGEKVIAEPKPPFADTIRKSFSV